MRYLYLTVTLAPLPLFLMGLLYSLLTPSLCGASYEMTLMWAIMSLAHLAPWIMWLQQLYFTRNT